MSHLYPLAISADAALEGAEHAALTRAEAVRLAAGKKVLGLETTWLTLGTEAGEQAKAAADSGVGTGFVQYYENAAGETVLAVTYWRLSDPDAPVEPPAPSLPEPEPEASQIDHTDDLYFRAGRTKKRSAQKKHDPNQMDLFGGNKEE